ncbi:ATP-binding protein [Desulfofarcimen acetoxidans]
MRLNEKEYLTDADAVFTKEAFNHAGSVRTALASGARNRRRYLVLQISTAIEEPNNWREYTREYVEVIISAFTSAEKWVLNEQKIREVMEREEELYRRISSSIDGKAGFSDIDFIIRRNTKRIGELPPPLPSREAGRLTPAIVSAFSDGCLINEQTSYITITNGSDEKHHQTFITFPDLPKLLPEVGAEWLASLEAMRTAVDAVVHFEIIKPHKAQKKVTSRKGYLKGQLKEKSRGDEDPSTDEEYAISEGRHLEGKISAGQPLASMSVVMAVAAKEIKDMRASAKRLMERYSSSGYRAVRPMGDQCKCFYSFLPGALRASPLIECDPGFISASGPTISMDVGDEKGFFIGWSNAAPVFWKPGYAAKELNRSNAMFISGALGSGKSLTIKLLIYLAYLAGAYLFIVDPKNNEYAVLEKIFPIKKINLCPGANEPINPFMLSKDERQAKSYVLDYLSIVLNLRDDNDTRRVAVSKAVETTGNMEPEKRNLNTTLEILKQMSENEQHEPVKQESGQCALLMESIKNSSLGHLVFGIGGVKEIARATVVNLQGLPLPRTAENLNLGRITENERQGLGLLYLASAMAREVAFSLPKDVVKVEVFDESWMLANISEGRRLLDELIRMSARSFGTIPILITQNTTDIKDLQSIKNNINYKFCFRAEDKTEIKANMEILGADTEENSLTSAFPALESGWCVMRDAFGRISQVYIDPRPKYLLHLFDTSPKVAQNE